ncbi:MAG TPA: glycosyltransferase family 4 protein [Chthoniobacterales bacterium]|nr:glycosyltransferase family 4 protein [Chthoniobacterales bacterium]
MKILFSSYAFQPSVGGIESVSKILAANFSAEGHDVQLITETPGEEIAGANYGVTRKPSLAKLVRLLRWSDLLFQNNISLRSLIPALVLRKPAVVMHQTWIQNVRGEVGWNDRIKRALLPHVTNIAISRAVADRLGARAVVVGNPYDDNVFRLLPNVVRDKTIAFLGRLVSDKGADLLLQAIKPLQSEGLMPDLTIVGAGPEEQGLRQLTHELGLDRQVTFAGEKSGAPLAELLNRHRMLVIPSRWAEPFGVVALEGTACGCVVIGSESGGLKEAIGPCGLVFPNGNAQALAERLRYLLDHPEMESNLRQPAPPHLARFKPEAVASACLELMQKVVA